MAGHQQQHSQGNTKWYLAGMSLFVLIFVLWQSGGVGGGSGYLVDNDHTAKPIREHDNHVGDGGPSTVAAAAVAIQQHVDINKGYHDTLGVDDATTNTEKVAPSRAIGSVVRSIQSTKKNDQQQQRQEELDDNKEDDGEVIKSGRGSSSSSNHVNGVILFLSGPMWEGYFFEHALPRLERNFLRCFPHYPVHVFHEQLKPELQVKIQSLLPSAPRVDFEDVSPIWKGPLPAGISEATLKKWMNEGHQARFQGRGYRIMCRFWAGLVWTLPSMAKYDYYWRLDTDSILPSQAMVDPFQSLATQKCQYGFNRLKGENPYVMTDLWPTYLRWLKETKLIPGRRGGLDPVAEEGAGVLEKQTRKRGGQGNKNGEEFRASLGGEKLRVLLEVEKVALNPKDGKFWGPMYYNNFELGTFEMKRHPVLQDMFTWMDSTPPHGFLRHRWGDAPWHTLAIHTVFALKEYADLGLSLSRPVLRFGSGGGPSSSIMCNFSKADVPYRHAARKPGPVNAPQQCPSTR